MSCRSNPGSSAVTSFARAGSGLGDMQTLSMFHQLMREGETDPNPTPQAVQEWKQNFRQQVQTDRGIDENYRQRVLNRLDNLNGFTPNGATFHAWQHMHATAEMGAANQRTLYAQIAATSGQRYVDVRARAMEIERELAVTPHARNARPHEPNAVLERARRMGQHSNNYLPQDQASLGMYSRLMDETEEARQARGRAEGMQFQEVESSVIGRVGYNRADRTLEVQFHTGRSYRYQGVSPQLARQLTDPNISAGRLYNREIRGQYPSEEVTPTQSSPATEAPPALTPTRCQGCGQFIGEGSHNCPASVVLATRSGGEVQRRTLGEMATTEDGLRTLQTLAARGTGSAGPDVINGGNNLSELSRQLLEGRAALAAEQTGATTTPAPQVATPVTTAAPPQAPSPRNRNRCANCGRFRSNSGEHSCQSRPRATRAEQTAAISQAATPLAEARAASVAAQTAAVATAQPPAKKYREDMTAFQDAYDAAKTRKESGQPPIPFMTENATGGLGARQGGRGFGVELEFDMSHLGFSEKRAATARIGQELHAAGLTTTARQERYHSSTDYTRWRFEEDCTVDGEIISPIMYDTPEDWEKLQKVCEIVQRNGGKASVRTGGHVHVACGNYDHTPKNHNNLLKMFKKNEDVMYRLSANPERGKHRGTRWCSPNQLPARDFTSIDAVRNTYTSHGLGLNFQSVGGQANDHVEFRMYDGSLDPAVIQSQIKLSLGMTEAAFQAGDGTVQATNPEPVGMHKRDNQAQHGRRRISGEAWENDTATFREMTDTIFSREEDKAQMAALFAVTKWQTA